MKFLLMLKVYGVKSMVDNKELLIKQTVNMLDHLIELSNPSKLFNNTREMLLKYDIWDDELENHFNIIYNEYHQYAKNMEDYKKNLIKEI